MRYLKIMGIFTSILSLLSCGHGNKRVTQNDSINSNIPVAARITIDKLPDVLRNVQAGNSDYDFIGICSNGVDCIYFVLEDGKFHIDFEAMGKEQLPYIDTLKQFAKEQNYPIVETTYNNLKSATKLFSVLLASKRPLITELADKLRLKYPLLPTISPCPTMRLEAIRSIIPISCRRYPKSV